MYVCVCVYVCVCGSMNVTMCIAAVWLRMCGFGGLCLFVVYVSVCVCARRVPLGVVSVVPASLLCLGSVHSCCGLWWPVRVPLSYLQLVC